MNLKAKIHIERQKQTAQEKLNARLVVLKERGLEDKVIERDSTLRHFKAEVGKANSRLAAIAAQEKLNQERVQAKIDKPAREAAKQAAKAEAGKAEAEKKEKKDKKQKQAGAEGKAKGGKGK
jgi:hypothetical protein